MAETETIPPAPAVAAREEKALERLLLFTDAVIAIVITLMVLEVKPPHVKNEGELIAALLRLGNEYLAVGVSFLVIGVFWERHHRRFRFVERMDYGLVSLNLLFLLTISAIPFVTAVIAQRPEFIGTALYAATIAVASLTFALLWIYAMRRGLTAPDLPAATRRNSIIAPFATAAIFLVSIPIARWHPDIAKASWLALLPVGWLTRDTKAK